MPDLFSTEADDPFGGPGGFAEDADDPGSSRPRAPLAVRMRPRSLDEVVGQQHLLAEGAPLRRLVEGAGGRAGAASVILWGPPGTGKTTLAHLVARATGRSFTELSAVTAGVKDVRRVMDEARAGRATCTSARPSCSWTRSTASPRPSRTRCSPAWRTAGSCSSPRRRRTRRSASWRRCCRVPCCCPCARWRTTTSAGCWSAAPPTTHGLAGEVALDEPATDHLVRTAGGDARRALTALEAAAGAALERAGAGAPRPVTVTLADAEAALDQAAVRYDRAGDQHYDVASALIKSMRGSDVDASLHYLARMLEAGEDPRFVARRIVIAASEDVGMADPTALQTAVAALHAVAQIGMPEARIVLAQAVVHLAMAPKSNAAYRGINAATADIREGRGAAVPVHLRGSGYAGAQRLGHGKGYVYPHDEELGVAAQQYAPDDIVGRDYYQPTDRGLERDLGARLARLRQILRGG